MSNHVFLRSVVAVFALACALAHAAGYPERPIRLIAPFAPGGNTNITARLVATGLSSRLGQSVVVENYGGAGGRIGTAMVANAAPDGYTLLLGSNGPLTINPVFSSAVPYDPLRSFAYTSLVSVVPLVLSVHPSVPAQSVQQFISLAKARSGRLTMGSAGVGSNTHLTGESFQIAAGIKLLHVPFKGSAQALVDVMGGQVDVFFDQLSSSLPYIRSGKLRALGIATLQRSTSLPDLPTLQESGLNGFEGSTYTGLLLPAATPKNLLATINAALINWLDERSTRESIAKLGAEVIKCTPEEALRRVRDDIERWKQVKQATNINIE